MKIFYCWLFGVFFLGMGTDALCQSTTAVALTKYTQSEGLSSYFITKIVQDPYGFLWVGTQEGLDLYDGTTFRVFSPQSESRQRLGGSFVGDVAIDRRRNLLWVLTSYGDVCGIDLVTREVKRRIAVDDQGRLLTTIWLRSLAIQGDTLWLGGLGALLKYSLATDRYLPLDPTGEAGWSVSDDNISGMITDQWGRLWLFSDGKGVLMMPDKAGEARIWWGAGRDVRPVKMREEQKLRFWSVVRNGTTLYAGTNRGLMVIETGELKPKIETKVLETAGSPEVFGVATAPDGRLFYSTQRGVYQFASATGRSVLFREKDEDDNWLTLTYSMHYDTSSGKLWLGTQSGLACFDPQGSPFTAYGRSAPGGDRIKHAYSLYPNNKMVYCGDENGLFMVNTESGNIEKISNAGSNLLLFGDPEGNIFVSNKSGFFLVQGKIVTPATARFPSVRPLGNDQFNSALCYNDSLILLGSVLQKGLTVWNKRRGTIVVFHRDSAQHPAPELTIINNLYRGHAGQVFILTEKAILNFDPLTGRFIPHLLTDPATRLPYTNFMDMCEMNGYYWIGTYGQGLVMADSQFRVKRVFTTREGLSNNCIYKAFPHRGQRLWITTNNGLSILDTRNSRIQSYYQSDGLCSSLFEQVCGSQLAGRIYAGGVNGFTLIDPDRLKDNPVPPKLYISHVGMQTRNGTIDTTNILLTRLEVPNNILQVTVGLSGLNYRNPGRIVYEYRIAEDNGDWIALHSQPSLSLPALPPGKYTLLFRAANESGIFTPRGLSLVLIYLPKWYQTYWFRLCLILVALLMFYGIYWYRLRQIQRQQAIRAGIAGDLHDDIGSVLNSAKIFAHLARVEPEKPEHLSNIEEFLSQASQGLRDMIWVLDSDEDTIYETFERIKKYAVPVCAAKAILFETSLPEDLSATPLNKTAKRNLLLIAKEAINNSVKYSECSKIRLGFESLRTGIVLTVEDDGKGFNPELKYEGNGMTNMRHRAHQINCAIEICSTSGMGTKIVVRSVG